MPIYGSSNINCEYYPSLINNDVVLQYPMPFAQTYFSGSFLKKKAGTRLIFNANLYFEPQGVIIQPSNLSIVSELYLNGTLVKKSNIVRYVPVASSGDPNPDYINTETVFFVPAAAGNVNFEIKIGRDYGLATALFKKLISTDLMVMEA